MVGVRVASRCRVGHQNMTVMKLTRMAGELFKLFVIVAQNQAELFVLAYANRKRGQQSLSLLIPCSDITFSSPLRSDHGLTDP
jgi:hypothetical protein